MKKAFLVAVLFLVYSQVFSQRLAIEGRIQDKAGKPIASANVVITNGEGRILLYSFSDSKGNFKFTVPDSLQKSTLFLEINALGYMKQSRKIESALKNYLFEMDVSVRELENVTVNSKARIKSNGDTLSYDVGSFSAEEDRTIGDVIKRLPGVSVSEDGRITVNGKNIENLLIHGDDLMSGRYGLATKTISKEMIKSIEVIQHFQPIKTLKDKVFSDDVVVNLVLKDENSLKLSTQAMLGLGFPGLVNTNVNLILLNKKFKALNSVRYNNSGEDYRNDFKDLRSQINLHPDELLSDAVVDNPGIPTKYIYQNNSFSVGSNDLYNTKDSLQLRLNVQYFFDRNDLNYSSYSENYVLNDTIIYAESQRVKRRPHNFNTLFTLLQNKQRYYLKNQLTVGLSGYRNTSDLDFNGNAFGQRIVTKEKNFSNDLQWIPSFLKRDVLGLNWSLNYYTAPQDLYIGSGIEHEILNDGKPYAAVNQVAEVPSFSSKLALNYYVNDGKVVKKSFQLGVENELLDLNSQMYLEQLDGNKTIFEGDYGNALKWRRNKEFFGSTFWIKKEYWTVNLYVPVVLQQIRYRQAEYSLDERMNNFLVNPQLQGEYFFNGENSVAASYSFLNTFGTVNNIYRGVILSSFREINSNLALVQEKESNELSFQYRMKRSIRMLFFNAGIRYRRSVVNSTISTEFFNNIQRTVLLPFPNTQSNISYNAGISKYFFPIKSKVELNASFSRQASNQYINNSFLPFRSNNLNLSLIAGCKLLDILTLNYFGSGTWISSKQREKNSNAPSINSKVTIYNNNISVLIMPTAPLFITVQGRQQVNKNMSFSRTSYFFADVNIRYRSKKLRTDFECDLTNLFDVKNFSTYYNSVNQLIAANYQLRGRMALLKATFNL